MKNTLMSLFILLVLSACSAKKAEVKSSFKLIIGAAALEVPMKGGVFVETEDLTQNLKNVIKLDTDNSATIAHGTYSFLFVAFTGPAEKSGATYCGAVSKASLISDTATIKVTINQTNCSQEKFQELISKITGSVSKWDVGVFDQGKWGP